jgi:hypothetical protein
LLWEELFFIRNGSLVCFDEILPEIVIHVSVQLRGRCSMKSRESRNSAVGRNRFIISVRLWDAMNHKGVRKRAVYVQNLNVLTIHRQWLPDDICVKVDMAEGNLSDYDVTITDWDRLIGEIQIWLKGSSELICNLVLSFLDT